MKIRVTFDLGPRERAALSAHHGWPKPASHKECKGWVESTVWADLMSIVSEWDEAREESNDRPLSDPTCNTCSEATNIEGCCTNKQCSRHGRKNDYMASAQ